MGLHFSAYSQNIRDDKYYGLEKSQDSIGTIDKKKPDNEIDTVEYKRLYLSGYMQVQFEVYQQDLIDEPFGPSNTFYIRRARLKFKYLVSESINFVMQPDFSKGEVSIKDAYAEFRFSKEKTISLIAGRFRRPNYESDYSSNEKEILDRARVLKDIYPDQRDIGLKLGYFGTSFPLTFQVALMNGTLDAKQTYDIDSRKDIMVLATYSISIPKADIGIDLGMNLYSGSVRVKSTNYVSDYYGVVDSVTLGDYLNKRWFSGEMQLFMNFLGGISLKGEYLLGVNVHDVDPSFPASVTNPYRLRYFSGYYLYFNKYVGLKNRFTVRYDYFDPNTKATGNEAIKDVYYKTLSFAWEYYLNNNISFALAYELPRNEINGEVKNDLKDNLLKAWVQVRF